MESGQLAAAPAAVPSTTLPVSVPSGREYLLRTPAAAVAAVALEEESGAKLAGRTHGSSESMGKFRSAKLTQLSDTASSKRCM